MEIGASVMENNIKVPQRKKPKTELPHDSAIQLLNIYPKILKH